MIKGKFILGEPPKIIKNENKQNGRHSTNKKTQPKKTHLSHHCGATRHTWPNYYKWLTSQQSNSVSSFGNQNQFQNSLAPPGEFLKAMLLLTNFQGFNPPSPSSKCRPPPSKSPVWKEKTLQSGLFTSLALP